MDIDDFRAQIKTKEHECLFDGDKHSGHFEEAYFDRSLTDWIEQIGSSKLYKAVKDLPLEDQIFISYIVKEGKAQTKKHIFPYFQKKNLKLSEKTI
ncbi:MAG: hypothetical protein RUMPE_01203 [Eubacteriales bacterium SKADARSKE-1]|nr:hypothetical protein [Eubacteriales bacterium SKADARSKE-1]MDQ5984167.1 hypothetical protein [Eubacteriales bacterium SKADARSKE-1]